MFQHIITPIDGSERSNHAVEIAARIAAECEADLELVSVVASDSRTDDAVELLQEAATALGEGPSEPRLTPLVGEKVAATIAEHVESTDGAMIVLSSTGRGRSAAVLGSVTDELVRLMFGPIIVVGPHVEDPRPLSNPIVVPVDGSEHSESSLPLAGAWGVALGATPWVVAVATEAPAVVGDAVETAYPARLARSLRSSTGHAVDFEALHAQPHHSPATAIVDFATGIEAGLVIMSTHGRTGLARLTTGSVTADVIHRASCPVVVHRPPQFADE